ncbi:molybdopterin-dependent oxidoreductase [Ornithinimicrobium tianjinense]|uniref:Oxidoreductase n=1 Tax=Ornithinimicrobium tianjinense TaxID=1195761 RepID=A0A917BFS6_9MICO|nr:molybdopterin-dependent oxidoreductase [Ornithinimicrobium tianjinense]GGF41874.1 putative oxidoreductase [Ornithinimicrobium tianjinense]
MTRPRLLDALCGVAAGAVTLGAAELLAALWTQWLGSVGTPSPLLAVGGAFVDRTPPWLKDWAVATFGTADKLALGVGMALALALVCALLGLLAARRRGPGLSLFVLVGMVGGAAVLSRPGAAPLDVVPTLVGVLAGTWVLSWLLATGGPSPRDTASSPAGPDGLSRRGLLTSAGALTALGVLGVVAGQALSGVARGARAAARAITLPVPTRKVSVPAGAASDVAGHSPYLTPNAEFYRIDTALRVPRVDPAEWRLRVTGLVEREIEISWEDLLAEEHVEALVTLTCVSNEVGGDLVGNARWQGWPVRELLARAGVRPEADMVLSRSVDAWTAGTPLEVLTDDRDALIAVAMNGEPLPPEHGFPARLVVPGLYGYVSATKWVTELKVTRFDADEGYWTPRGWSALGPVKTASRIDVPRPGAALGAGEVVVAGVAWAQHRGVSAVEVQVDGGPWSRAELLEEPSVDAWRLWRWTWPDAAPGEHVLRVRATDATGAQQVEQPAPPAPDGATGWHQVRVSVS